ncbi:MAG TPA: FecR domain-containing protein [Polyangiaceae bacterium]|nr:FecR domain-containing protein [Polyangiaceae bacterium]
MARPLTPLGELGAIVSQALDDDGGARLAAIDAARERFEATPGGSGQPVRRYVWLGAALAAAAAVLLWFLSGERALSCEVEGEACEVNAPLRARPDQALALRFSDGSTFALSAASSARLLAPGATGAEIVLDQGRISAQVVHTGKASWRVLAGPFTVRVTGTAFDATWQPATQSFALSVSAGSVVVSGLGVDRLVRAGEQVAADMTPQGLAWQTRQPAAATVSAAPSVPAAELEATPSTRSGGGASSKAAGLDGADAAWRALAKQGDLRGAFAAAQARGFDAACDAASPSELLLLGDAARVSGHAHSATDALLALRRRYPHDARRAAAAFSLGKVAFDQLHDYGQAAEWFAKSQSEQPSGRLAREAAGRRIEALRNAGHVAAAGQAARDYLERYPDGPHAELARAQLK